MTINISSIFSSLQQQQLPALINILNKAADRAQAQGIDQQLLLEKRLIEDMHPLQWQVQTVVELVLRGAARLLGEEPVSLQFKEHSLAGLMSRVAENMADFQGIDLAQLNQSAETQLTIPIGPEATLTLSGQDYVVKFLLPNIYFHLTTTYNILRANGVALGKSDFMGPIS